MDAADRVAQELREEEKRRRDAEVIRRDYGRQTLEEKKLELTYKTTVTPEPAEAQQPWWGWVQDHVAAKIDILTEAFGQALGMKAAEVRGDLMREINLLKREFAVLQGEVAAANKLKALQEEIMAAKAAVPQVPTIVADFEAKQTAMKKEARSGLPHEHAKL